MDHAFPSSRKQIEECTRALQLIDDASTIAMLTPSDCEHVRARTEDDLPPTELKTALLRNASRIGVLLRDIDDITAGIVGSQLPTTTLVSAHADAWGERRRHGTRDATALLGDLKSRREMWSVRKIACEQVEHVDDASSSYSDYSDENTETDDEDETPHD